MPKPLSPGVLRELWAIVGRDAVLDQPEDLLVYEYDAYLDRAVPDVVVQPVNAEQIVRVVRLAASEGLAVTPRGGATGLSGGVVPIFGGIMVDFARMHHILEVDVANRAALVEPGLFNLDLSTAVAPLGLYYAPDPSSQKASTIGGNIAENAGGPHCLASGMTTNHIRGVELVTRDGELVQVGGQAADAPGYDLVGLVVGSEGTFGIVTKAWVRLLPIPPRTVTFLALFQTVDAAGAAVSSIIGQGIVPSALELIDGPSAAALERAFKVGYPPEIGAVLLIDVAGLAEAVAEEAALVGKLCEAAPGALGLRYAATAAEREGLWKARKGALAALALIAPNYYLCDGVVPRSKLAQVLRRVAAIGAEWEVLVTCVAHVGDGNLHPLIAFDVNEPGILPRVEGAHDEIIRACVDAGGTITGEHGVGIEKRKYMPWIFAPADLDRMARVRAAFDPSGRFNPGKVLPTEAEAGTTDPSESVPLRVGVSAGLDPERWV
ncbi:MAG: FAD-binding protein [Chloroflexi bacterium]|nr:FAD-binding protein [Chloroflexota bacterium]